MLTERHRCTYEITFALGSYVTQIQLLAKEGQTDSAKAAEDSLIDIVNIAYNCNFVNMNTVRPNHPGIDWKETRYGTGLQVTVTETSAKIENSIDTIIRNNVNTSRVIWFLMLTTNKHGQSGRHSGYNTQTITINDLVRQICALPDQLFFTAVEKIKEKLGPWFSRQNNSDLKVGGYKLPSVSPVDFINHHNLWDRLDSKEEVPPAVFKQLQVFADDFSKLPLPIRIVIAKIVQHAPTPKDIFQPLEIELDEFYYHLGDDERDELAQILGVIEKKYHGHLAQTNPRIAGDGITINYDHYIQLSWRTSEPDMNIYTALKIYYLAALTVEDLYKAFEQVDFSLLR
ncbi:SMEK domain-containing protein [Pseudomonas sp. B21-048]|uniref:SMEK domain-containing protein n=1 Tax=Pseudomonas sp. B21-048 TaxID=2895490 RepID=UPI00215E5435|nr:SMEK domain-containing protein [Pseudomonas sp. B21-048]UVL00523.1 SMEK domain-containing protein [Pseudomonas sp. B21-048]